jgi:hypothetical protein
MTRPDTNISTVLLYRDGNAGGALMGENIQDGESEFVCIDDCPLNEYGRPIHTGTSVFRWACTQALRRLEKRIGQRLGYRWDF